MTLQKGHHGFPFLSFITPSASDILRWTDRLMTSPDRRASRISILSSVVSGSPWDVANSYSTALALNRNDRAPGATPHRGRAERYISRIAMVSW